jgi:LPXTG-site transpeptidase (sortase) family protein
MNKDYKKINRAIFWLLISSILAILCYIVFLPFYPGFKYALFYQKKEGVNLLDQEGTFLEKKNSKSASDPNKLPVAEYIGSSDRVIIPKIGVNVSLVEADNEEEGLSQGAWRLPYTSKPDQGGNTVIAAHRFKYLPPSNLTFYLLDKLEKGDKVILIWQEQKWEYVVQEQRVVEADDFSILDKKEKPTLTLLTCHPPFSSRQRLIVIATLNQEL